MIVLRYVSYLNSNILLQVPPDIFLVFFLLALLALFSRAANIIATGSWRKRDGIEMSTNQSIIFTLHVVA